MNRGHAAAVALILSGTLVCVLRRQIAVVTVAGPSMRPAFGDGDRVLVRRARLSRLRPGHVVVLEKPGPAHTWSTPPPHWPGADRDLMIKRVAALPGDPVPDLTHPSMLFPPLRALVAGGSVPAGTFVALGDNPGGSYDSRVFGCCPADRLLGVVMVRLR